MKNENFAERLFCDLKNAGIKIEKPEYIVEGVRIGQFENSYQFNIFGVRDKFNSNQGIAGCIENGVSFTEAYADFLEKIKNVGNVIKFYSLVIPRKGVIEVKLEEFETVISRYIKDYLPQTDDVAERWDIYVQKRS